ncbi:MAG: peptidoglycan recognition family protein [Gordonia sp. (in: high G+C Gram-positive bacteria)]
MAARLWNDAAPTWQVIVVHSTESDRAAAALAWMESQRNGSYHVLVDTTGDAWRMVPDDRQAWAAMSSGNRIGLHVCAAGRAAWSRSRWLSGAAQVEAIAAQLASWSAAYGIPLVRVTPEQIRRGVKGVCTHADISVAFGESDHTDPGVNYPLVDVITRAQAINGGFLMSLTDQQQQALAAGGGQLGDSSQWGKTSEQVAGEYSPSTKGWARRAIERAALTAWQLVQKRPSTSPYRGSATPIGTTLDFAQWADGGVHAIYTELGAFFGDTESLDRVKAAAAAGNTRATALLAHIALTEGNK